MRSRRDFFHTFLFISIAGVLTWLFIKNADGLTTLLQVLGL